MKCEVWQWVVTVGACLYFGLSFLGCDCRAADPDPPVVEDLASGDKTVSESAVQYYVKLRTKIVGQTIMTLGGSWDTGGKRIHVLINAIKIAGEYRISEAVPPLVDHLTFTLPKKPGVVTPDDFPCIEALVSIGLEAVESLMERCEQTTDATRFFCTRQVLVGLLDQDVAKRRIEERMEKADSAAKREALGRLLEYFRSD